MIKFDKSFLNENIIPKYGKTFYFLDVEQFGNNYDELLSSFRRNYVNTHISYSYKTNYSPLLCHTIDKKDGYAEIVSDMEFYIARKLGISYDKIIFNGPYKKIEVVEELLLNDGIVNIDSWQEYMAVKKISEENLDRTIKIGLRVNFDIGDNVISRFGFDVESKEFYRVLQDIANSKNIVIRGLHSHFASRNIKYWPNRASKMIELIEKMKILDLEYISLGGGIYGKMHDSLKAQFTDSQGLQVHISTYDEYSDAVLPSLATYFFDKNWATKIFIEPGSALVGDCMNFYVPVVSIKNVRQHDIATVLGSRYNINPTLNDKNPPIRLIHMGEKENHYDDVNIAGFTCIESDYLYKHYSGDLAVDDIIEFSNVGSYSIVLKPPFILPNFPILAYYEGKIIEVKRKETNEDVFETYVFDYK